MRSCTVPNHTAGLQTLAALALSHVLASKGTGTVDNDDIDKAKKLQSRESLL